MSWNAQTYLQFADQRTRPAADLLARVPLAAPARIVDLGCGTGNSTALLSARWPGAALTGIDSSPAMLEEARRNPFAAQWQQGDIAQWQPEQACDLIFSNAALQWLDDQKHLLPRLMGLLAPGVFAFQVPGNYDAPSHRLMRDVAAGFGGRLDAVRTIQRADPQSYYEILKPQAASLDIWRTEYLQVLDGEDAVYRWVSGTGLRPYLDALDGAERDRFIASYKEELARAYPRRADGTTLFAFQRVFVVATASR